MIPAGTLYTVTLACANDLHRIEDLMRNARRVLVDLRCAPWSATYPAFDREALDLCYNIQEQSHLPPRLWRVRYLWDERLLCAAPFGSICGDAYPVIADLAADVLAGRDVILLCTCHDDSRCHRLVVAKLVQDTMTAMLFSRDRDGGKPIPPLYFEDEED
jgi:DNA-binding transcriptional LysR family regulator